MDVLADLLELLKTVLSSVVGYFDDIAAFFTDMLSVESGGIIKVLLVMLAIKLIRKLV